ncbi:MAG: hypothetical protein U0271_38500 [Polyangiaceae bacterium]
MDPTQIAQPNVDATFAAFVGLQVSGLMRAPERAHLFTQLPPSIIGDASAEGLERLAWTVWFLDSRCQSMEATSTGAKVDPEVIQRGTVVRRRMTAVLRYNFLNDAKMQAELDDIGSGQGHLDMATDMTRLSAHYSVHKQRLAADKLHYDPNDEFAARSLANEIITNLRQYDNNPIVDLRNRALTLLTQMYATVKAAADFLFRNSPRELALFPTLRTAVLALGGRSRTPAEPAVEPAAPQQPAAPAPEPAAPVAPVGPGLPGGNPLEG